MYPGRIVCPAVYEAELSGEEKKVRLQDVLPSYRFLLWSEQQSSNYADQTVLVACVSPYEMRVGA